MNRLRELREERGWNLEEVAKKIGAHFTGISKYELSQRALTDDLIAKFCDLYDVTADYLLGRSSQRHATVSEMDTELIAAYNDAPMEIRNIVDTALEPYKSKKAQKRA